MPRPGFLTPSTFHAIMSHGKSEEFTKTGMAVINQLALDMIGVERPEQYTPAACQWGIDNEWLAVQVYQDRTMRQVTYPATFQVSPDLDYVGGTCDGLITTVGGLEVKCPYESLNHLENLREALQFKTIYKHQVQGYLWIYERSWWDCESFDPRFPEPNDMSVYRAERDKQMIQDIKERCKLAYEYAKRIAEGLII